MLVVALGLLARPVELGAWPRPAYRNMVFDTLRLMPPSLGRVLGRNREYLVRGVYRLEGDMASHLARDGLKGTVSPETTRRVERRIARAVDMVNRHRPFREVAFELGKLLRIAADLADPTIVGAGRIGPAGVSAEFHRFVLLHLDEIPLVYDDALPSTLEGQSVSLLLRRLTAATGASVVRLAEAFWKDGRLVPATAFDFRSVPYAEASLGYSRGVTAASYLWLDAWSKANGDFTGYRFFKEKPKPSDALGAESKQRP
ncbi:MAG: hypothetical protein ACE5JI_13725 [Acidobacteriota bacterium]